MDRLSALDASFLYGETPETPMHVAGLAIFEPPPPGVKPFAAFRDHIVARLHLLPFFHRKLALSPVQLDHPAWVEDDAPDLEYHIRHMALPKPGSDEQLRTLVARLHMILLDRARPLWQYYVIEGLEGGRFAAYVKMHHAAIDGGAGMAALETIFGYDAQPAPVAPPPRKKAEAPNIFEMISESYANFFYQQRDFIRSWPDMSKALANVGKRLSDDLANPSPPMIAPKTIFNAKLSNQRSFGTCTLSLTDAKSLGKALGAKLNDVVMAISAGALRRYLRDRDALPTESLIAAVPVSLREAGNTDMNNQVTVMLCRLATDIADPIERLKAIVASATDSKQRLGDVKDVIARDMSFIGAPIVLSGMARLLGQGDIADQMPAVMNVLISNVPGPRKTMYCAGAAMTAYYPVSIPAHGGILNITVQSYLDRLDFGLIACRAAVPDIDKLTDLLVEEFAGLQQTVAPQAAPAPKPKRKATAAGLL